MKTLFISVLLIIYQLAHAQPDKQKHLFAGTMISYAVSPIVWKITGKKNLSSIVGFSAGVLAGFAKERYDRNEGVVSKKDIKYTALGALIGSVSFRIIINKSERAKDIPIEETELPMLVSEYKE